MTAERRSAESLLKHRRTQVIMSVLIGLIFLFFVFDRILMPLYTRQGSERPVPKLVGLSKQKAIAVAESSRFVIAEEAPKLGGRVPEGTILEQHPFAGSLAKPGRKIRVIPAMPAPRDVIPDLAGLEARDAQIRCRNVGLVCSESDIRYRFSERVPKGYVISQDPQAGHPADPGQAVKITVSQGPEPAQILMPSLIEKTLAEARLLLRDAGLRLGKIVRKETSLYENNTVIAQSIRTGEHVKAGASVDIVIAIRKRSPDGESPAPPHHDE